MTKEPDKDKINIPCHWITENAPIYQNNKNRSFRRYLMTPMGPVAYITPYSILFEKYSDNFNKKGAHFTWSIVWLFNGRCEVDGTAYGNRTLEQVEKIVVNTIINGKWQEKAGN